MYTTSVTPDTGKPHKRSWRRHSDDFKARVIALALEPHASLASVALAHGINANMLRRWVRAHTATTAHSGSSDHSPSAVAHDGHNPPTLSFVQLPTEVSQPLKATTPPASRPPTSSTIEVQIQRGDTRLVVRLPMTGDSATWLREVLI